MRLIPILIFICLILPAVHAQGQSWCGIQTLYFQHNATTTPAGYEELINYPSGNPEVDENVSIKNTDGLVLIDNYIMPENSLTHTQALLEGLRRYRFYSYVDSAVGTTTFNFTAFRRFINGTEQNFYSAQSTDIDALTITEYDLNYVSQVTLSLNPTDRLGIRVYASTTHPSPIVVHWVYQGNAHASHFESGYFSCPAADIYVGPGDAGVPLKIAVPVLAVILGIVLIVRRKNV